MSRSQAKQRKNLKERKSMAMVNHMDPAGLLAACEEKLPDDVDQEKEEIKRALKFSKMLTAKGSTMPTIDNRQFQKIIAMPGVVNEISYAIRDIIKDQFNNKKVTLAQ